MTSRYHFTFIFQLEMHLSRFAKFVETIMYDTVFLIRVYHTQSFNQKKYNLVGVAAKAECYFLRYE